MRTVLCFPLWSSLMMAAWAELATPVAVLSDKAASAAEKLAAKEFRRYWYLRTGTLLPIVEESPAVAQGGLIVLGTKDRPAVQALVSDAKLKAAVDGLAAEHYILKTLTHDGQPVVLIAGGDPIGTLYGAYRLAEHLGVRFYMHGDVMPDAAGCPRVARAGRARQPLFDRRGIQPFHDFPEGPDWWNRDNYKAILGQLPKMRMNFFGLHTYPEGGVGPEPLVWIGPPEEFRPGR